MNSKALKLLVNLICFFSFTTTFVTPELLHFAAHAISKTSHVDSVTNSKKESFQSKSQDSCTFDALLSTHTSHTTFTGVQKTVLGFDPSEQRQITRHTVILLSRIAHQYDARGPPKLNVLV